MQYVYFLRYSCSNFLEPKSSRITSIQIHSTDPDFEIKCFGFDRESEIIFSNKAFNELSSNELDQLEKRILEQFNDLLRKTLLPQNRNWFHWQMDDNGQYGFECLRHRWRVLFGEESYLSLPRAEKRFCLKKFVKQKSLPNFPDLGQKGRSLEILAEHFELSTTNLLHGEDEANCFLSGDWKKISTSGTVKIKIMKEVYIQVETPKVQELVQKKNSKFINYLVGKKDEIAVVNHLSSIIERTSKYAFWFFGFLGIASTYLSYPKIWNWLMSLIHLP